MCMMKVGGRRVASMTVNAAQSNRLGLEMRVVLSLVARYTPGAFGRGFLSGLPG
jgi:hypothetical protein